MSSILALLKILLVPVAVAAFTQTICLLVGGLEGQEPFWNTVLANRDAARNGFVSEAIVTLVLTYLIVLPFFRSCARRDRSGYAWWLLGWGLVYSLPVALFLIAGVTGDKPWVAPMSILISSIFIVCSLWWWLFYAERPAETGRST